MRIGMGDDNTRWSIWGPRRDTVIHLELAHELTIFFIDLDIPTLFRCKTPSELKREAQGEPNEVIPWLTQLTNKLNGPDGLKCLASRDGDLSTEKTRA